MFFFLSPFVLQAQEKVKIFYTPKLQKFDTFIKVKKRYLYKGKDCLSSCEVERVLKQKRSIHHQKLTDGSKTHQGARVCQLYKAFAAVAYTQKKDAVDICVFADGSKIFAWDLYDFYQHNRS